MWAFPCSTGVTRTCLPIESTVFWTALIAAVRILVGCICSLWYIEDMYVSVTACQLNECTISIATSYPIGKHSYVNTLVKDGVAIYICRAYYNVLQYAETSRLLDQIITQIQHRRTNAKQVKEKRIPKAAILHIPPISGSYIAAVAS